MRAVFCALALLCAIAAGTVPVASADGCQVADGKAVRVYVLRGWLDVYSMGMGELTERFNKIKGIKATVHSWGEWPLIAAEADKKKQPIVLIGHSRGVKGAVHAAVEMQRSVAMIISYDGAPLIAIPPVPSNVRRLVDISANGRWMSIEDEHNTQVRRVPTGIGHAAVDDDDDLQALAVAEVCRMIR